MRERVEQTLNNITGGDNFARVSPFHNIKDPADQWSFMLVNDGPYPAYDLEVSIEDITKASALMQEDERVRGNGPLPDRRALYTQVVRPGTLAPHMSRMPLISFALPSAASPQYFRVSVVARNGVVTQNFLFKRLPTGEWRIATRTAVPGHSEVEDVPKDFPRDAKGGVGW
jgi:hypothetical protein